MTKAPAPSPAAQARRFLVEFLKKPSQVGSVAPSSSRLARRMVDLGEVSRAATVVEYGPGTGPMTGWILKALPPAARFFAIELSPDLCRVLRARYPGLSVREGSAADVERFVVQEGFPADQSDGCVDTIISGLPWVSLPQPVQHAILDATLRVLRPGGAFVTFGYTFGLMTASGRRFHALLQARFRTYRRSEVIWGNLPPAVVAICHK